MGLCVGVAVDYIDFNLLSEILGVGPDHETETESQLVPFH